MMIVDTSVWVALYDDTDSQHVKAVKAGNSFFRVVLTEYIILETSSLLLRKAGENMAEKFLEFALDNSEVTILYSSPEFFRIVSRLFRDLKERKLSFVDVSLLHLSRAYEIVTFDEALRKEIQKLK